MPKINSEAEAIEFATNATKGAIHHLTYENRLALSKKHSDHTLIAVGNYTGRFAVDYYNTKSVIERLGEEAPHQKPNGLQAEIDNVLYKNAKGENIIRFYPIWSAPHSKVYILDGEAVTKEALLEMGFTKSELHIREGGLPPEVINLKATQITEIN